MSTTFEERVQAGEAMPLSMAPPQDEGVLLAAVRRGDRSAAERIAAETYRGVFAALMKLSGDPEIAADLTQETYRKAWQSLGSFDGRAKLSTWLFRIAYTTWLNRIRTPQRLVAVESLPDPPDPGEHADSRLAREESEVALRRAVGALPDDLRFTVTAHFWAELPVQEIAKSAGVTSVAIRKRLRRALSLLEVALEGTPS